MKIKICGIRSIEELEFVERYADFAGVVLDPESKRFVDYQKAEEIIKISSIPVFAVLTSENFDSAFKIAERVGADHIQIHTDGFSIQDFERLKEHGFVLAKAFRVSKNSDEYKQEALNIVEKIREFRPNYAILDTGKGSGEMHDLRVSTEVARKEKIILAGGLNPENVRMVVDLVKPFGVDVSSGVERNGRKDLLLVEKFCGVLK